MPSTIQPTIWNRRRRFFAWGASLPLSDLNPQIKPAKQKENIMKNTMKAKETTTRVRNSSNHWPWWRGLLFIELLLGLAVLAVSPLARAVSPPPDGGYSGLNTA